MDVPAATWRDYSVQVPANTGEVFILGGTYQPQPGLEVRVDDVCLRRGACGARPPPPRPPGPEDPCQVSRRPRGAVRLREGG